jgi:hypothetical protein
VLFTKRFWPGIADGSVTVTFRRWKRRQVVAGGRYRTPAGIVEVESVDIVDERAITDADAHRSGFTGVAELVGELRSTPDPPLYRIVFRLVDEPDPRDVLAGDASLTSEDVAAIGRRLERIDRAAAGGAWTRAVLEAIARKSGVARSGSGGVVRPGDGAVQARRPQAEEPRADDQPASRLPVVAAGRRVPQCAAWWWLSSGGASGTVRWR